jgi:predicted transcriptional regulator
MKNNFVGFRVNEDQLSRLERMAEAERRTVSNLLRVLIEREAQRQELEKNQQAMIKYNNGGEK